MKVRKSRIWISFCVFFHILLETSLYKSSKFQWMEKRSRDLTLYTSKSQLKPSNMYKNTTKCLTRLWCWLKNNQCLTRAMFDHICYFVVTALNPCELLQLWMISPAQDFAWLINQPPNLFQWKTIIPQGG